MTPNLIAITNLNIFSALALLLLKKNKTVLFYKKTAPLSLYARLVKKHRLTECSNDYHPDCYDDSERDLLRFSEKLLRQAPFRFLIARLKKVLNIADIHLRITMQKYYVKLLRDDIKFITIVHRHYTKDGKIKIKLENHHILKAYLAGKNNMSAGGQVNLHNILSAGYYTYNCLALVFLSVFRFTPSRPPEADNVKPSITRFMLVMDPAFRFK